MKNTGIKDKNGNKIYVGSKVIKASGWVVVPGKPETMQTIYKTHTIVEDKYKDEYQSSRRYRLGKTYNSWTGEGVVVVDKVMAAKLDAIGIKEDDAMGFFIINGNPVIPKPWEYVGMLEHEYEKIATESREIERKHWFGE